MHLSHRAAAIPNLSAEHPISCADRLEVPLFDPTRALTPVFLPCPPAYHPVDVPVYLIEGRLADHVTMVVGPPSDDCVELDDQRPGIGLWIGFQDCTYLFK
jgi:hypothetical protein